MESLHDGNLKTERQDFLHCQLSHITLSQKSMVHSQVTWLMKYSLKHHGQNTI